MDETFLVPYVSGTNACDRFKAVFGSETEFVHVGDSPKDDNYPGAYTATVSKPLNSITTYTLVDEDGVWLTGNTNLLCGNLNNQLELTRCTVIHELGHVLIARAYDADQEALPARYDALFDALDNEVFGHDNPCTNGPYPGPRWDPGEHGWPWRDHPITGPYATYNENLCTNEYFSVVREFEADMFMNYALQFFNPQNSYELARSNWIENTLSGENGWIQQAKDFTAS